MPGQIRSEHIEAPTLLPEICPSVECPFGLGGVDDLRLAVAGEHDGGVVHHRLRSGCQEVGPVGDEVVTGHHRSPPPARSSRSDAP